jgi:hypothetical protein
MEVGDNAGQDDERPTGGEDPPSNTAAVEEEPADTDQQWKQGETEGVVALEDPHPASDCHTGEQQVPANHDHGEAHEEDTDAAGCTASSTHLSSPV